MNADDDEDDDDDDPRVHPVRIVVIEGSTKPLNHADCFFKIYENVWGNLWWFKSRFGESVKSGAIESRRRKNAAGKRRCGLR